MNKELRFTFASSSLNILMASLLQMQSKYGGTCKEYVSQKSTSSHLSYGQLFSRSCQIFLQHLLFISYIKILMHKVKSLLQLRLLQYHKRSISETTVGRMSGLFGSFSMLQPKEENKGMNLISDRETNQVPRKLGVLCN